MPPHHPYMYKGSSRDFLCHAPALALPREHSQWDVKRMLRCVGGCCFLCVCVYVSLCVWARREEEWSRHLLMFHHPSFFLLSPEIIGYSLTQSRGTAKPMWGFSEECWKTYEHFPSHTHIQTPKQQPTMIISTANSQLGRPCFSVAACGHSSVGGNAWWENPNPNQPCLSRGRKEPHWFFSLVSLSPCAVSKDN